MADVWAIVPKLTRMPWNDKEGSPVYLDIRRWLPMGDIFDVDQNHAALPILPGLMPGGPLVTAGEVVLNRSSFTGQPITLDTDTPAQTTAKLLDYAYKSAMPNILGLPGTYATSNVGDAIKGRTDVFGREQSVAQAVASSFGVKLASYPEDVLRINAAHKGQAQISEIDRNISQLKRQLLTHRIDREEFDQRVLIEQAKQVKIMDALRERVQ